MAYSEIEPFPCAHLSHHYPEVVNLGDVTQVTEERIAALGPIDVLTFGSPCQDFSVAGDRAGLEGERSGLVRDAIRIARWMRKHCGLRFAMLENVVGILSASKGRDFAAVVGELAGLASPPVVPPKGWGTEGAIVGEEGMVEWAVLDAQWFGVAQRRRRVFALVDFGDWTRRPPILLEPEGLRGDSAPRRAAGEDVAGTLTRSLERCSADEGERGTLVARDCVEGGPDAQCVVRQETRPREPAHRWGEGFSYAPEVARCVATREGSSLDYETTTMVTTGGGFDVVQPLEVANTVAAAAAAGHHGRSSPRGDGSDNLAIGFYPTNRQPEFGNNNNNNVSPTLKEDAVGIVTPQLRVRRLTPRECERLQGMPDDYTLIPFKGKPSSDTVRYKAIGNSAASTVLDWIAEQIEIALWCEKYL